MRFFFRARERRAKPVAAPLNAAHPTFVVELRDTAQRTAEDIVARARAARELGASADSYRAAAAELDRQADRAETLLLGEAVQAFRAAAARNRLIADALDMIEGEDS